MNDKHTIEAMSNKKITQGVLISYLVIFVNIISGLFFTPWLIEELGQASYGLYTIAISLITLFMLDFGLGAAVSKYISEYLIKKAYDKISQLLGMIYKLYLIIDIIVLIILVIMYVFLESIYTGLTISELQDFKMVFIIVGIYTVLSFPFLSLNGIFIAHESFKALKLLELFQKSMTLILMIIALIFGLGLFELILVNAMIGLVVIVLKLIHIKTHTKIKIDFKVKDKKILKTIFTISIWATLIAVSERLMFTLSPSILGIVSTTTMIALFGVASAIEGYLYVVANAINGFFLPKITRIYQQDNSDQAMFSLFVKLGRLQLIVILLVFSGFVILGQTFIQVWLDESYLPVYMLAILLMIPSIFYFPQELGNQALMVKNKLKLQSYVFIMMAIINIILTFIFGTLYGALGAVIAIFIAYSFRSIVMNLIYQKHLKINLWLYYKKTYLPFIFPLLITFLFGYVIWMYFDQVSWFQLLINGSIVTMTFLTSLYIVTLNLDEKKMVSRYLSLIFKKKTRV
jgi:O-antigen/teichoic acid export membrane protein